jgi:hypothetical protein
LTDTLTFGALADATPGEDFDADSTPDEDDEDFDADSTPDDDFDADSPPDDDFDADSRPDEDDEDFDADSPPDEDLVVGFVEGRRATARALGRCEVAVESLGRAAPDAGRLSVFPSGAPEGAPAGLRADADGLFLPFVTGRFIQHGRHTASRNVMPCGNRR